jgi:hypothetical protein
LSRLVLACLVPCAAVFVAQIWEQTHHPKTRGWDFQIYYDAAFRFVLDPGDLYREETKGKTIDWLYPPAAIALILPFRAVGFEVGYRIMILLGYLALGACSILVARAHPIHPPWLGHALFLGLSPAMLIAERGQVDGMVLLVCLVFATLVDGWPRLAAGLLAAGAWVKIYPAGLLVLCLAQRSRWAVVGWFAMFAAAIPLALLPIVPAFLYPKYAIEYFPAISNITVAGRYSQSLGSFLARARSVFPETLEDFTERPMPWSDKALMAVLLVSVALIAAKRCALGRWTTIRAASVVLAMIPVCSPLGWEYTFVFAVPAVVLCFAAENRSRFWLYAGCVGILGLCIPAHWVVPELRFPPLILNLLHSRYVTATLCVVAVHVADPDRSQ